MRLVSGIDATDVCVNGLETRRVIPCACREPRGCMGEFVHIEQDSDLRLPTNYDRWAEAFEAVFPPSVFPPLCSPPLRDTEELEENVFKVQL